MYTAMVLSALCNMIYLALHVTGSSCFPQPLSKEEEQECLRRIEQGDEEAKNELIEHNLRLVAHIIKKYYASYRDQEDLISIGTIGLIKAASTFNSSKGTKFATYASRCIENEILMYFRQKKKTMQDVSINDPIDMDKDGNSITLMDIVQSDENIVESIDLSIQSQKLYHFLETNLEPREQKITFLSLWLVQPQTAATAGGGKKIRIFPGAMYPALRRRRWGS
jgi:spore_sigmaK: RNA polymerase sigma-K factor